MTLAHLIAGLLLLATAPGESAADDPLAIERAKSAVIRAAVERAAPAIVTIETIGGAQPITQSGQHGAVEASFRLADGPTTGLVLSSDGYIITSSINFAREPSIITVTLHDGRRLVAKLLGRDHIRRLALIKVDAKDLPVPRWLRTSELSIGQYAIACGRALGGTHPSISLGIVSALGRRNGNAVQTDAKVSPINYGGPLLDIEGHVMGILVPMAGSGGALAGAEWYDSGIGFAIYREKIDHVLDRLAAGESIEQGKIGVVLGEDEPSLIPLLDKLIPPVKGVKIKEVAKHSPASRVRLREGDKILAIDGAPTGDLPELQRRLSDRAAGEEITITIKRRWRTFDVTVRLVRGEEIGRKLETDDDEVESEAADGKEENKPDTAPESQPEGN